MDTEQIPSPLKGKDIHSDMQHRINALIEAGVCISRQEAKVILYSVLYAQPLAALPTLPPKCIAL